MNSTTFAGDARPVHNAKDRSGQTNGTVTLTRPGFQGAWFGVCSSGHEELYSKKIVGGNRMRCKGCKP